MRAYVGVDWCATGVACSTALEGGKPRSIRGAEPTVASVRELIERVRTRHPAAELHVIIENGAPGWTRLFHAVGCVVHVVDPKQSKRFAESLCSSGAKDDARDADSLVMMGQSPSHLPRPWEPEPAVSAELAQVAAAHEQVTSDGTRDQQRLRALLREHMPLVDQAIPNVDARWVATFLGAVPTPWHARDLTREQFDAILKGSGARHGVREDLWAALKQTEAPWMTESVAEAVALRVGQLLTRLGVLRAQERELEKRIDALTTAQNELADTSSNAEEPEVLPELRSLLESVPGIGLRQAVALILCGLSRPTAGRDDLGVRMGASPVFTGSGRTAKGRAKGHVRMRRAAPARARRAVYLLGRLAALNLNWAHAMYADARHRGQSAATAYRRVARSMLRIVTAMVRDKESYDNDRYVALLKAKGVRWAADLECPSDASGAGPGPAPSPSP